MAQSFLLLSALPTWKGGDVDLSAAVAIRKLNHSERAAVNGSEADGYWICHQYENPHEDELARHKKRRETVLEAEAEDDR